MKTQKSSAPGPGAPVPATSEGRPGESPAPAAAPEAGNDEAALTADLLDAISELPSLASETPPKPDAEPTEAEETEGPPEAEAETASETASPDSEEPPESDEDEPGSKDWPPKAKRRLSKLIKKIKALEGQVEGAGQWREERDRLQADLESAQAASADRQATPPPPPPAPEPAPASEPSQAIPAGVITAEEVRRTVLIQKLTDAIGNIEQHPDGMTLAGQELSAEDLGQLRRQYERRRLIEETRLDMHREAVAAYGQKLDAQAPQDHAWLKLKADPRTQQLESILAAYPGARNFPGIRKVLADAIAWESLQQAAKAKGNGAPPRSPTPPPRQPARPAAAPAETAPAKANLGAKYKRYEESGSTADLADLVPDLIETRT